MARNDQGAQKNAQFFSYSTVMTAENFIEISECISIKKSLFLKITFYYSPGECEYLLDAASNQLYRSRI